MGIDTILIIDDDVVSQRQISVTLRSRGYITKITSSSPVAVKIVQAELIDVVVLDISMPGWMGMEILREIHTSKPKLPVIITSAFTTEELMIEALERGAYSFMRKPVNTNFLNDLIEEAVGML
ncbi:response regulator [Candidatus Desantisbacteria bacterium]|nr:response regulator [Candidatus Desantisbacteria bacterium]